MFVATTCRVRRTSQRILNGYLRRFDIAPLASRRTHAGGVSLVHTMVRLPPLPLVRALHRCPPAIETPQPRATRRDVECFLAEKSAAMLNSANSLTTF